MLIDNRKQLILEKKIPDWNGGILGNLGPMDANLANAMRKNNRRK